MKILILLIAILLASCTPSINRVCIDSGNLPYSYDSVYHMYRFAEPGGRFYHLQPPVRDSSGKLIRDSSHLAQIINKSNNKDVCGRNSFGYIPEYDEIYTSKNDNFNSYEAADHYINGIIKFEKKEFKESIEELNHSIRMDTLMKYNSDINLWKFRAFSKLKDSDSATFSFNQFKDYSARLCPANLNIWTCPDSVDYSNTINDSNYIDKKKNKQYKPEFLKFAPYFSRPYYGFQVEKEGEVILGPDLTMDGIGLWSSVQYNFNRWLSPIVFYHMSKNASLWGGGVDYSLFNDRYNRFKIKSKYYIVHYRLDYSDEQISINEPMIGLETSYGFSNRLYTYASGMMYYNNQLMNRTQSYNGNDFYFENYYDIGATLFFGKNIGITLKNSNMRTSAGMQYGSLYLGIEQGFRRIILTTILFDNLFKYN